MGLRLLSGIPPVNPSQKRQFHAYYWNSSSYFWRKPRLNRNQPKLSGGFPANWRWKPGSKRVNWRKSRYFGLPDLRVGKFAADWFWSSHHSRRFYQRPPFHLCHVTRPCPSRSTRHAAVPCTHRATVRSTVQCLIHTSTVPSPLHTPTMLLCGSTRPPCHPPRHADVPTVRSPRHSMRLYVQFTIAIWAGQG